MKNTLIKFCAVLSLVTLTGFANAGLIGDTVGCQQTGEGTFSCDAASAIVGPGNEFGIGSSYSFIEVDISDSIVDLFFPSSGSLGATVFVLSDLDWSLPGFALSGVSIIEQSGITGFDLSDLSFTDDSLTVDLIDTDYNGQAFAQIGLQFTNPAAVPAPATLALFGLGLAGFAFVRRKRS